MPAKSVVQQQAAGAALAAKRGETSPASLKGASKEMYDSMSANELEKFASTSHEHLPQRKEEMIREYIKNYIKECMDSNTAESEEGELYETDKWIQKAINPDDKGDCTPMSKPSCTPHKKALARRFKSGEFGENVSKLNSYIREALDEMINEKWDTSNAVNPGKVGMFKGRSEESLRKELENLKKTGPHKKGSAAYTKEKELIFALRAKHGFGPAEGVEKLRGYIQEAIDEVLTEKKWIQKAINPDDKGDCTPMSKPSCTPHKKALARRFKSHELKEVGTMDEAAFSRQHYTAIANIIKNARSKEEIASELADLFDSDNPNFLRDKFLSVAGIHENPDATH